MEYISKAKTHILIVSCSSRPNNCIMAPVLVSGVDRLAVWWASQFGHRLEAVLFGFVAETSFDEASTIALKRISTSHSLEIDVSADNSAGFLGQGSRCVSGLVAIGNRGLRHLQ